MISCSKWKLYVIIDRAAARGPDLRALAAAAIRGGADVIQLRDKGASDLALREATLRLMEVTRPSGVPLILNDRADVARLSAADGVHVGQDDLSIREARQLLGPERLIGKSTHSLEQALRAQAEGADYVGFGPLFATPTKPDYQPVGLEPVRQVNEELLIPVVCIGGIDLKTVTKALEAGVQRVAVVRAVCAAENPEKATHDLKQMIVHFFHARHPLPL